MSRLSSKSVPFSLSGIIDLVAHRCPLLALPSACALRVHALCPAVAAPGAPPVVAGGSAVHVSSESAVAVPPAGSGFRGMPAGFGPSWIELHPGGGGGGSVSRHLTQQQKTAGDTGLFPYMCHYVSGASVGRAAMSAGRLSSPVGRVDMSAARVATSVGRQQDAAPYQWAVSPCQCAVMGRVLLITN